MSRASSRSPYIAPRKPSRSASPAEGRSRSSSTDSAGPSRGKYTGTRRVGKPHENDNAGPKRGKYTGTQVVSAQDVKERRELKPVNDPVRRVQASRGGKKQRANAAAIESCALNCLPSLRLLLLLVLPDAAMKEKTWSAVGRVRTCLPSARASASREQAWLQSEGPGSQF